MRQNLFTYLRDFLRDLYNTVLPSRGMILMVPDKNMTSMIELAMNYYGATRNSDPKFIRSLFKEGDFPYPVSSNYCGIFMNYLAKKCEKSIPEKPEVARNWLKVGLNIADPKCGDIVVFWRESKRSWKGHVGIFLSWKDDSRLYCLGGNQGYDKGVNIQVYHEASVLGYRRL